MAGGSREEKEMIEVTIRLEEQERVYEALGVETDEEIRERLVRYLNTIVDDHERGVEMQKTVESYEYKPLIELQE